MRCSKMKKPERSKSDPSKENDILSNIGKNVFLSTRYDMYGDDEESGGKSKQGRNYQSWQ